MTTFISRRELLRRAGLAGAAAVVAPAFASGDPARGVQTTATAVRAVAREPLENLTAAESDVLEAIVARLIPSDANGPGAAEARAAHYIDRALGGALATTRQSYTTGLAALDRYARSSRGGGFAQLSAADQDAVLTDVESGAADGFPGSSTTFFAMVRAHTLQGTFGDPVYGGNASFVGWDLVGYPGVRTIVTPDEQRLGADVGRNHKSAYDYEMFTKASASAATSHDPHHGD
jgi:gluconate 2-dehydrogenase gamma chain